MSGKVLITGANGACASWLLNTIESAVYTDIEDAHALIESQFFIMGDLKNKQFCNIITKDVETIIHLGGESSPDAEFESVVGANIIGTGNLIRAAIASNVKKIIFASSNHTIGLIEKEIGPTLYSDYGLAKRSQFNGRSFAPDGYYGASKLFCEGLLDYFVSTDPMRSAVSLRIGTIWREEVDSDNAEAVNYITMCENSNVHIDTEIVDQLILRQKAYRVSGPAWRTEIWSLLSKNWSGHYIKTLVGPNKSWLQDEFK